MKNLIIGITGGIGGGKSTVSKIIIEEGFTVLFADSIAKNIMNSNKVVRLKIINEFGDNCYKNDKLVPQILASKVFKNPSRVKKLNSIVHPSVIEKIHSEINLLKESKDIIFVEVPLLFEAKMTDIFDYILLVTADIDTRIKRVLVRDNKDISEIKGRIESQIPEDQKRSRADFVIDNVGNLEELTSKTQFFLKLFKSII